MPANATTNNAATSNATTGQGRYWCLTIPKGAFESPVSLPHGCSYAKGQLEVGAGGFEHWQIVACFAKKVRLRAVKAVFGSSAHCELSRSAAANDYVWKDETAVPGTRFELGELPLKRNDADDWKKIKASAKSGNIDEVPDDIYIRYYGTLKRIALDHLEAKDVDKTIYVYWGVSGSGKSHRAREEAGKDAYIKDPCTKWWDGYQPNKHKHVIIEEFTGTINISHILRWFDKWSSTAEQKGGGVPFVSEKIWITSNVNPLLWYPDANPEQLNALLRRMKITEFKEVYKPPVPQYPLNDNRLFWHNAPKHEGIPIGDVMDVPEWRDYLGDLLEDNE